MEKKPECIDQEGMNKTVELKDEIGCFGYAGGKQSLAEMDAGVLEEARKQAAKWSR